MTSFVDTSFWFSVQDRLDRHHAAAAALALAASHRHDRLVTSNHVVGETWTTVRRRLGHGAAVGFLDRLHSLSNVEIVHIDDRARGRGLGLATAP